MIELVQLLTHTMAQTVAAMRQLTRMGSAPPAATYRASVAALPCFPDGGDHGLDENPPAPPVSIITQARLSGAQAPGWGPMP